MAQIPQAGPVALGHLHIGQQVMGQADGLGPLQVGIARDHHLGMPLRLGQQGPLKAHNRPINHIDLGPQPQAQVGAHLVVAGATGVELLAQGAQQGNQPPLHGEVHVFILQAGIELACSGFGAHLLEARHDLFRLLERDHPGASQHAGVGDGAVQVLL